MTIEELTKTLRTDSVRFKYKKKDGTIREAYGTTNMATIEQYGDKLPKGNSTRKENENQVRYFDIDKNEWRSFCKDNYIDENNEQPENK